MKSWPFAMHVLQRSRQMMPEEFEKGVDPMPPHSGWHCVSYTRYGPRTSRIRCRKTTGCLQCFAGNTSKNADGSKKITPERATQKYTRHRKDIQGSMREPCRWLSNTIGKRPQSKCCGSWKVSSSTATRCRPRSPRPSTQVLSNGGIMTTGCKAGSLQRSSPRKK